MKKDFDSQMNMIQNEAISLRLENQNCSILLASAVPPISAPYFGVGQVPSAIVPGGLATFVAENSRVGDGQVPFVVLPDQAITVPDGLVPFGNHLCSPPPPIAFGVESSSRTRDGLPVVFVAPGPCSGFKYHIAESCRTLARSEPLIVYKCKVCG